MRKKRASSERPMPSLSLSLTCLACLILAGLLSCSRQAKKAPPPETHEGEPLAAAVDFCDPRYSVTKAEAEAMGLLPLGEIRLPRRALAVDGLFPGEAGYPFGGGKAKEGSPFLLDAVGDIQIGPEEGQLVSRGAEGRELLFGSARRELERAAILVGNLEGPVSLRGEENPRKRFHFRFPPGTDSFLKDSGFDLLLFANNHAFDYGAEAFSDSLEEAAKAGIPLIGAGEDLDSALKAVRLPASGMGRTGMMRFIGFADFPLERSGFSTEEAGAGQGKAGINSDEEGTLAAIRAGREAGDFVVVLAHGGNEYRFDPAPEIEKRYRGFIEAGAGLVLGSHPHLLQGLECYKGGLIAYSLGNFLFTGEAEPSPALESAILQLLFYNGEIRGIGLRPVFAGIGGTELSEAPSGIVAGFASRCRVRP